MSPMTSNKPKHTSTGCNHYDELASIKRASLAIEVPAKMLIDDHHLALIREGGYLRGIPARCGLLDELDLRITNVSSVTQLLEKVHGGEWKSEDVARAFIKRARIAQQVVNCLTETFFDRAMERAKELDDHLARTGKVVGPLHGLPISLKEQIPVKGVESTSGWVGSLGERSEEDCVLVRMLDQQGAILYCRTNMTQGCLWPLTATNNLYGDTLNPYNAQLNAGGSSVGEGALLAMRGSLLGIGSDNGGSLRFPATLTGGYSLKGSYGRIPYIGMADKTQLIKSVMGPMSSTIDGLRIFTQAMMDARPWEHDPLCPRMPWSEEAYLLRDHRKAGEVEVGTPKLVYAIMWSDGIVMPDPPVMRALKMVKEALEGAGHEVVDWVPYKSEEMFKLFLDCQVGRMGVAQEAQRSGEPLLLFPEPTFTDFPITHLDELDERRKILIKGSLDHWNATAAHTSTGRPVDAIVAPILAAAPFKAGEKAYWGYTTWCNISDYTAAAFPVTAVDDEQDGKVERYEFISDWDKFTYEAYDPSASHGMPVGLQCVGRRYEEEAVIRMTEIIDGALKTGTHSSAG